MTQIVSVCGQRKKFADRSEGQQRKLQQNIVSRFILTQTVHSLVFQLHLGFNVKSLKCFFCTKKLFRVKLSLDFSVESGWDFFLAADSENSLSAWMLPRRPALNNSNASHSCGFFTQQEKQENSRADKQADVQAENTAAELLRVSGDSDGT